MARERKSKKEALISKIAVVDEKINGYSAKIAELTNQKEELNNELKAIESAEKKAQEEANTKAAMKLLKDSNISLEELKSILENR